MLVGSNHHPWGRECRHDGVASETWVCGFAFGSQARGFRRVQSGAKNLLDGAESRSLSVYGDAEAVAAMGIARVWEGVPVVPVGGRPLVKGTALPGTGVSGGTAGSGRWLGARAGHWERRGTTEAGPHTIKRRRST